MQPTRTPGSRRVPAWLLASLLGLLAGVPTVLAGSSQEAPPDLRLVWLVAGATEREAPPVRGRAGETVRIPYRLRNVGGRDAFAAILSAHTALGPVGDPKRVQPGPEAGAHLDRHVDLPLADGAREICLEATLQSLEADEPGDPNRSDNVLCRKVELRRDEGSAR